MARFALPAAAFLLILKDDKVLLIRRCNTGWSDGNYDLVAGHIEGNEFLSATAVREASEEVGIIFDASKVSFAHLTHCLPANPTAKEYLYVAFKVTEWTGEPKIMEPHLCDDLQWFPLAGLPPNLTPGTAAVIAGYLSGSQYSEITC